MYVYHNELYFIFVDPTPVLAAAEYRNDPKNPYAAQIAKENAAH